jgi:hypothetical protein
VDDGSAEAHFDAGFGRGVERVVVAVEAVEQRGFEGCLGGGGCVGGAGGGWGVVYCFGAWGYMSVWFSSFE